MRVPKYRKHTNGLGFVEFQGKRTYFKGRYNSVESSEAYRQFLAANVFCSSKPAPAVPAGELTVMGLVSRFLAHAKQHYPAGNRSEYANCRNALKPLAVEHGRILAESFGPRKLKDWQEHLARSKNSRSYVNGQVARIKRAFKWAVSEELIPASVYQSLATVPGLQAGRSLAREPAKRQPVAWESVEPVLAELRPVTRAMVLLQWYTGARSGSICAAKPEQFAADGDLLLWRPRHKTEHRGIELIIPIGPKGQAVLEQFLQGHAEGYIFSPQSVRRSKKYRARYKPGGYANAIRRAIKRVNEARARDGLPPLPHWSPHQLRHSKGKAVREQFGVEAQQAVLGHETLEATQVYSQRSLDLAKRIAREVG